MRIAHSDSELLTPDSYFLIEASWMQKPRDQPPAYQTKLRNSKWRYGTGSLPSPKLG